MQRLGRKEEGRVGFFTAFAAFLDELRRARDLSAALREKAARKAAREKEEAAEEEGAND